MKAKDEINETYRRNSCLGYQSPYGPQKPKLYASLDHHFQEEMVRTQMMPILWTKLYF